MSDNTNQAGCINLLPGRKIYTVSALNREVRALLELNFSLIWLEGEVSNLSRPASGHLYFSLKDSAAQIRCALFRNRARFVTAPPANGQQVLVRARISLYEARGDYQLIVEHLEDAGEGALRRAFEELRQRLDQEGLFSQQHKLLLPLIPKRVGVITSPSGAAIRDVLSVLKRRFPGLPVLVYPVPVQGENAAVDIARTIQLASQRRDCDVLLLVRGGGSLEDLWSFNEEIVARAIHACTLPLVCGVGHESDVTIADFCADMRAPTPSAAAELVSPDAAEWLSRFRQLQDRLRHCTQRQLSERRQALSWLHQTLMRQHPGRRLQDHMLRLDELEQRLQQSTRLLVERRQNQTRRLAIRLSAQNPLAAIRYLQARQQALLKRLQTALNTILQQRQQRLATSSRALHHVSPLQTLGRGYAIIRDPDSGVVIKRAEQAPPGSTIQALLDQGCLLCRVEESDNTS